jgi:nitrilase
VISRGGSCILDPFGKFLAGPNFDEETILVGEIDRSQLAKAKFDFDAVGHYARPDIFQLVVDDEPKEAVVKGNSAGRRSPTRVQNQR